MTPRERAAQNARRNLERAESHVAHLRYCVEVADAEVDHCRRELARLEAAVGRSRRTSGS
jgi:hypothetical protein